MQPHNFYSGEFDGNFLQTVRSLAKIKKDKFLETVKKLSRNLIIPLKKTDHFMIADFKAIEGRLAFWLIGSKRWLESFRQNDAGTGPEPYVIKAGEIYKTDLDKISKLQRKAGKEVILSANYGLSATKLHRNFYKWGLKPTQRITIEYTDSKGKKKKKKVDIDPDSVFSGLRISEENIKYITKKGVLLVAFKKGKDLFEKVYEIQLEKVVNGTAKKITIQKISYDFECGRIIDEYRESMPELRLTWKLFGDAFKECYHNEGTTKTVKFPNTTVVFKSIDKYILIRLPSGRTMFYAKRDIAIKDFYGAKVFQNVIQCIARDVEQDAIIRIEKGKNPFSFFMDVHDEIVATTKKLKTKRENDAQLNKYLQLMEVAPDWAKGLVIKAEGEYFDRYKKI